MKEIHAKTATEFLQHLLPHSGEEIHRRFKTDWVYRGQSQDFPLVPSVARSEGLLKAYQIVTPEQLGLPPSDEQSPRNARDIEFNAIVHFASLADLSGYSIPGDDPELRLPNSIHLAEPRFPPSRYLPMAALAQHHGIPTRLLDWSKSPLVAAYFAASEAAQKLKEEGAGGPLVVVAVCRMAVQQIPVPTWDPWVQFVTVPYASNPNLRRQRGLFTVVMTNDDNHWPFAALDQVIAAGVGVWNDQRPDQAEELADILYKVTLPRDEAPRLLHYLTLHGVSAASVFEGLDNVTRALRERRFRREGYGAGL